MYFLSLLAVYELHGQSKCPVLEKVKMDPHYTAQQKATHCSFAVWQKLLGMCRQFDSVYIKKEFFADYTSGILQDTKTVERDQWISSDFFL